MALTITEIHRTVFGNKRIVTADLDFDASYPTNGEPFAPADVGLRGFDIVMTAAMSISNTATPNTTADLGHSPTFDYTNNLVIMTYSDLNGAADGPSIEVANAVDLTGVRVRVLIVGY
jgi:hypothetical protein